MDMNPLLQSGDHAESKDGSDAGRRWSSSPAFAARAKSYSLGY